MVEREREECQIIPFNFYFFGCFIVLKIMWKIEIIDDSSERIVKSLSAHFLVITSTFQKSATQVPIILGPRDLLSTFSSSGNTMISWSFCILWIDEDPGVRVSPLIHLLLQLFTRRSGFRGLPWWSSGWDSMIPLQGAWVWSLVGELRSHMLCGVAKKKKSGFKSNL